MYWVQGSERRKKGVAGTCAFAGWLGLLQRSTAAFNIAAGAFLPPQVESGIHPGCCPDLLPLCASCWFSDWLPCRHRVHAGEELRAAVEEWQQKRGTPVGGQRLTTAFLDGTHPIVDVYELKVGWKAVVESGVESRAHKVDRRACPRLMEASKVVHG